METTIMENQMEKKMENEMEYIEALHNCERFTANWLALDCA